MPGLAVKTTLPPFIKVVGPVAIMLGLETKMKPGKLTRLLPVVMETWPNCFEIRPMSTPSVSRGTSAMVMPMPASSSRVAAKAAGMIAKS